MPITHQTEGYANHPAWIRRELDWILSAIPLATLGSSPLETPLTRIDPIDTQTLATDLGEQWAWHGAPKRLGRRFEQLLSALFEAMPSIRILAQGVPIHAGEQTRGEIDFLLRYQHAVIHLEVALKYYVGIGDAAARMNPAYWVGPSTEDRLDRKINHLHTHQLPLSTQPETLALLSARDLPQPTHRQAWIFGRLIHPYTDALNQNPPRPNRIVGSGGNYWCCYRDRDHAFRVLSRPVGSAYGWRVISHDALIGQHHGPAHWPIIATAEVPYPEHHSVLALVSRTETEHAERARLWILPDDFVERAWLEVDPNTVSMPPMLVPCDSVQQTQDE